MQTNKYNSITIFKYWWKTYNKKQKSFHVFVVLMKWSMLCYMYLLRTTPQTSFYLLSMWGRCYYTDSPSTLAINSNILYHCIPFWAVEVGGTMDYCWKVTSASNGSVLAYQHGSLNIRLHLRYCWSLMILSSI